VGREPASSASAQAILEPLDTGGVPWHGVAREVGHPH
jgi:hypothetical protein